MKNRSLKLLVASMGLAFSCSAALAVDPLPPTDGITIDFTGTSTQTDSVPTGSLDWAVGSSLANDIGICTTSTGSTCTTQAEFFNPENYIGNTFDLYSHANLAGGTLYLPDDPDNDGASIPTSLLAGMNEDWEWTYIAGFTEEVTDIEFNESDLIGVDPVTGLNNYLLTTTQTFQATTTQDNFFFEIYYDDNCTGAPLTGCNSSTLAGTGYDDGLLILQAAGIVSASGDFSATIGTFLDVNSNGTFESDVDIVTLDVNNDGLVDEADFAALDSFNTDNWSNDDLTYLSVTGSGGTLLDACLDCDGDGFTDADAYQDRDFFQTDLLTIITDLVFSTENVAPFSENNPSMSYDCDGEDPNTCTLTLAGGDITLGTMVDRTGTPITDATLNGGGAFGEDVLFQTDANQGFLTETRQVPEPGTIALLGIGLGLLGFRSRRRLQA